LLLLQLLLDNGIVYLNDGAGKFSEAEYDSSWRTQEDTAKVVGTGHI
jgi:hypothetical protein